MRTFIFLIPMFLPAADLTRGLTFHATFDGGTDARVARGDKTIYSAASYKEQAAAAKGFGNAPVELAKGRGRKGDALRFTRKNTAAVFYKADENVAFDPKNWTGTVSFWLSLDPERDLEPGYCDPIQITDKAYNDSAIWVDFTKDDKPRHFRLGVFGDLKIWNPRNLEPDKNPDFLSRLAVVKQTPFARGKWTHVAVAWNKLGSGKGAAKLYLDGKPQASAGAIAESFAWDRERAAIRLGVNYVGLLDDLAVYDRELSAADIAEIAAGRF